MQVSSIQFSPDIFKLNYSEGEEGIVYLKRDESKIEFLVHKVPANNPQAYQAAFKELAAKPDTFPSPLIIRENKLLNNNELKSEGSDSLSKRVDDIKDHFLHNKKYFLDELKTSYTDQAITNTSPPRFRELVLPSELKNNTEKEGNDHSVSQRIYTITDYFLKTTYSKDKNIKHKFSNLVSPAKETLGELRHLVSPETEVSRAKSFLTIDFFQNIQDLNDSLQHTARICICNLAKNCKITFPKFENRNVEQPIEITKQDMLDLKDSDEDLQSFADLVEGQLSLVIADQKLDQSKEKLVALMNKLFQM